jgi:uncharacterized protein YchJ
MTLVSFALYGDRAEFVVDTASYTQNVEQMGQCTKFTVIQHVDTVILNQGDGPFGYIVKSGALQIGAQTTGYDELVNTIPEHARQYWATQIADRGELSDSVFFLIGWSAKAERFAAHGFASERNFKPFEITSTFVMPTPWDTKPSDLELTRFRNYAANRPDRDEIAALWAPKPPMRVPTNIDDWRNLGLKVREHRSLSGTTGRVIVAGDLIHGRLKQGRFTSQRLHRFNDAGEEFLQMVAFTAHPQSQTLPCWCDSGKTFIDCHLAPALDTTCGCGSGQTFRECCAVTP